MRERLGVWMTAIVVVTLITSAAVIGFQPADDPGPSEGVAAASDGGAGPMNVTDIRLQNRSEGLLEYDVEFEGEFDKGYLQKALVRTVDSKHIQASSIRLQNVSSNVATVEVATNGDENAVTVSDRMLRSMQLNESKTPAGESKNETPGHGVPEDGVAYYQVDFVEGEPIHNLGDNGTYQPDELIRYAHGSSENLLKRSSNGEFTTNEKLGEAVESSAIVVKSDGTARVSFSIKEGVEPVTLSLVSYTKPGPIWTRASEDQQEFVDADTRTFKPGGTYTLRVDLPTVENDTTTDSAHTDESTAAESDAGGAAGESTSSSDPEGSASTVTSTSSSTNAGSDATETSDASASTLSGETATPTTTETVEVRPNSTPTMTPTPMPEDASSSARSGTSSASTDGAGSTSSESERSSPVASDTDSTTEEQSPDTGSTDAAPSSTPDTTSPADDSATTGEQADESPATETESESGDSSTSTEAPATDSPADTTSALAPTTDESDEQPSTDQPTSTTDSPDTEVPTTETTTEADETPTTTEDGTEQPTSTTEEPSTEEPTEQPETETETATPTETATETATETPTPTETATATPTPTETVTETPTPTTTEAPDEGPSGASVSFNDQSLEEAPRVVVESVTLPSENGGFVVVYDAGSFGEINRPDDRIGISGQLSQGTSESVNIDLKLGEAVADERLTAVVVNDTNGNGRYDPGVDMGATTSSGEIATDSANVAIAANLLPGNPGETTTEEPETETPIPTPTETATATPTPTATATETPTATETTTDDGSDGNGSDGGIFSAESTTTEASESETTSADDPTATEAKAEATSLDEAASSEDGAANGTELTNAAMDASVVTAPE